MRLDRDQLVNRVAGVLKSGDATADANVAAVEAAGMAEIRSDGLVTATDAGRAFFDEVRGGTAQFTAQLWGDLPAEELEIAARVLGTAPARADALLGVS